MGVLHKQTVMGESFPLEVELRSVASKTASGPCLHKVEVKLI